MADEPIPLDDLRTGWRAIVSLTKQAANGVVVFAAAMSDAVDALKALAREIAKEEHDG